MKYNVLLYHSTYKSGLPTLIPIGGPTFCSVWTKSPANWLSLWVLITMKYCGINWNNNELFNELATNRQTDGHIPVVQQLISSCSLSSRETSPQCVLHIVANVVHSVRNTYRLLNKYNIPVPPSERSSLEVGSCLLYQWGLWQTPRSNLSTSSQYQDYCMNGKSDHFPNVKLPKYSNTTYT